jgi:RNA polymerase sigma-70 factor (ECF subfamily)
MSDGESFDDVMVRLCQGDDSAAADVFHRFGQRLTALARTRLEQAVRQKVDPEDVLQSVFKSFFLRHQEGQFQIGDWDSLWTILTVITVRKCSNQRKFFYREQRDVRREVPPPSLPDESEVRLDGVSREPTPEEAVVLAETVEVLMVQLDKRDREIISLRLQGNSTAEISAETGFSERTVRRVVENVKKYLLKVRDEFADAP